MARIYNLEAIALGDELKAIAFEQYPNLSLPSSGEIAMAIEDKDSKVVGIRFPIELLEWIDSYSRIGAVNKNHRITRNTTVIGFLETMKALMEYQERTQWGKSHQEMIAELLGKQSTGDDEG